MAVTPMPTTDANTRKLWAMKGFIDMFKTTWFGHLATRGSIFQSEELANASKGDNVTYNFTGILTGLGGGEGFTQEGNEEALDNHADTLAINVVRHAVNNPNRDTIEQQRTLIDFQNRARILLPKWHGSRLDASMFNQLAGVDSNTYLVDGATYAGVDRLRVQGNNAIVAPSTDRIIRAGGKLNDESLTAGDTFNLDLIDAAIEAMRSSQPTIELLEGDEMDLYISPEQETDLKRDTTGKIQWFTVQLAHVEGGMTDKNKIINGSRFGRAPIAKYANVNIYSCTRVANGENSGTSDRIANVRRAVMVGKNALVFGSPFGGRLVDSDVPLKFFDQLQDYEYLKGIEARMIYGAKKLVFDGEDYGVVTLPTYAASHTF
jgi:hypothetical protein